MIRTFHLVISGYTQSRKTLHGCARLWGSLTGLLAPTTFVDLLPWDYDMEEYAEFMRLNSNPSDVRVLVYAYSWGCGDGFTELAEAMKSRGMIIDHAVLADPVYYSRWFEPIPGIGHALRGFGVWRQGDITIPSNVRRVDWFRQTNKIPKGCDLVAANPARTDISKAVVLGHFHEGMDDAPEWHDACLRVAGVNQ